MTALRSLPAATLAVALFAGMARAQEAPVELARNELIREAEEAARRGDHALAIERARRAAELRATPSVSHFLAREHEALDLPLETLSLAAACERGAEADRGLHNRDALLRACRAIVARATARVGRVVVRFNEPVPSGLAVRVAGTALPEALLGVPFAVAPGVVRVEAEAPGYEPAHRDVTIEAGRVEELPLTLTPRAPPLPPPPPPPIRVEPAPRISREPAPPNRTPWIAVGAGLSALAVGGFVTAGVLYGIASEARAARDLACAAPCAVTSPGYAAATEQERRYRDHLVATNWSLVVGASLTAASALWWVLARPARPRVDVSAAALPGGARVAIATTW